MAKISRDMLKAVVKECLFEILLESTGESKGSLMEARKPSPKKRSSRARTSRPSLDSISFNSKPSKPEVRPLDVSGITSDPVMASIFQDTAQTTLVEQAEAERGRPGQPTGPGIPLDSGVGADGLGEASKNWAYLAFHDKSE